MKERRMKTIFKSILREISIKGNCTKMTSGIICEMETMNYWAQEE